MTDIINCLVILIAKDDNNIAAMQLKIKHFNFSTSLNSALITFMRTYNNNNNNLTCKAPVCAKKTSVALADRTSR